MMYSEISTYCLAHNVTLVVVSKMRTVYEVMKIYNQGHRIFAENRVQELLQKYQVMPKDIQWHLIGTLQKNKVKYLAPFIQLIHSVDDFELWNEINKQAIKQHRCIPVLLQIKISDEESKNGFEWKELLEVLECKEWKSLDHTQLIGVMGMASLTEDQDKIRSEFKWLKSSFDELKEKYFNTQHSFNTISMGMSGDYKLAIEEGSTMVRIGSAIFN
mgnify:CR=1 FL=1